MGVIEDWKSEYAEALNLKSGQGSVFHHVHPRFPGYAHCNRNVKLFSKTVSAPPIDMRYCERCQRISESNLFLTHKTG